MDSEEGDNPGHDFVREELCHARMQTHQAKLDGLRNQIIGAIMLSTAIITLVMWLLKP